MQPPCRRAFASKRNNKELSPWKGRLRIHRAIYRAEGVFLPLRELPVQAINYRRTDLALAGVSSCRRSAAPFTRELSAR